ncbi:MAG TPA: response regulator, partial [Thermoanaerobaculia bacterium]|nr:response regulator [Thermoanaerobaculia bacterium]
MSRAAYRILLVDDDADDRALCRIVLTSKLAHVDIVEVADAVTFAQACARRDFDVVILEQRLHWSDGLAVLGSLKELWPELPVIFFTRHGDEELAVKATRLGVEHYLPKRPATFLQLPLAVDAALDRARARARP